MRTGTFATKGSLAACDEGKSGDLGRREVRRVCDEGQTGSFLEGSDLNEDVTASKLLSNDYIIATIKGSGNVVIKDPSNISFTMHRVLHAPGLPVALFSVSRAMEDGLHVVFDKGVCTITDPKSGFCLVSKFLKDLRHGAKLFRIHTAHIATTAAQLGDDTSLWHQRLGHIGITSLKNIGDHLDDSPLSLQNVAKSSPLLLQNIANSSPATICTPCMQGKQTKLPHPSATSIPSTQVLQLVRCDLCGPMQVASIKSHYYIVTFIDDYSRWASVYTLPHKASFSVTAAFEDYLL